MTCMIAWPTWLVWLVWISLLFLFYYKFSKSYFLAFWAWGNGPPPIWKENQQNFEKDEISFFRRITHILFPWGIGHKREENKKEKKKGRNEGIFLQQIWGVLLEGWYIYVREEREKRRIFLDGQGQKSARRWKRSNCNRLCPGMLLVTLGVLTHIWFLHFGHLEISNVLLFGVDGKGHKLFCWDWSFTTPPCFDFDYFICHWCLWKYRTHAWMLSRSVFFFV